MDDDTELVVSRDAMQGLATGNRAGKPAERSQEILTPQPIVNFVLRLWPEGISMDPCASTDPRNLVDAVVKVFKPGPNTMTGAGGLDVNWHDRTYVNPPFKELQAWLAKASVSAVPPRPRVVLLCPVRSHRSWWRRAARFARVVVELDPVKFVGYDDAFPAPLCLMVWGSSPQEVHEALLEPHPIGVVR
jgi:hypothetical protein